MCCLVVVCELENYMESNTDEYGHPEMLWMRNMTQELSMLLV